VTESDARLAQEKDPRLLHLISCTSRALSRLLFLFPQTKHARSIQATIAIFNFD
jgi:hypothetical protein